MTVKTMFTFSHRLLCNVEITWQVISIAGLIMSAAASKTLGNLFIGLYVGHHLLYDLT